MITEKEYNEHLSRIEKLLKTVNNDTPITDDSFIELNQLSDLVADFEEENFPLEVPSLVDVIKLRMFELNLKQKDLANILQISTSRISEYLSGKREITLPVAKKLHTDLNIDAEIILS